VSKATNPLIWRLHNLYWELRLGISTHGIVDTAVPDASHYATMRYATIFRILEHLSLQPSDVLIDVGSGKGRLLCLAARYRVRELIGVEMVPELCRVAEENSRRMRGRKSPITIYNMRAQEFDYTKGTVLTLFNPFGAETLSVVVDRIRAGLQRSPRPLRIAYANPEHDHVLAQCPWLDRYDEWLKGESGLEHGVTFYKSNNCL
jgi:SAM-dependent methyltransferase